MKEITKPYLKKKINQLNKKIINLVAKKCDELDHHPTWENTYNKIRIELNTHDINGISSLDFELANYMNKTFKKIKDGK